MFSPIGPAYKAANSAFQKNRLNYHIMNHITLCIRVLPTSVLNLHLNYPNQAFGSLNTLCFSLIIAAVFLPIISVIISDFWSCVMIFFNILKL